MPGFHHSIAVLLLPPCHCRLKQNGIFLQIFLQQRTNGNFFTVTATTERNLLRSYFLEERNFSNGDCGNGRTATEWWKRGVETSVCSGGWRRDQSEQVKVDDGGGGGTDTK